jgi:hypothetical protein
MSTNLLLPKVINYDFTEFKTGSILVPEGVPIREVLEENIFYLKIDSKLIIDLDFKTKISGKNKSFSVWEYGFNFPSKKAKTKKTILVQAEGFIFFKNDTNFYVKVGEKKDGFFELLNLSDFSLDEKHSASKCECSEFDIDILIE